MELGNRLNSGLLDGLDDKTSFRWAQTVRMEEDLRQHVARLDRALSKCATQAYVDSKIGNLGSVALGLYNSEAYITTGYIENNETETETITLSSADWDSLMNYGGCIDILTDSSYEEDANPDVYESGSMCAYIQIVPTSSTQFNAFSYAYRNIHTYNSDNGNYVAVPHTQPWIYLPDSMPLSLDHAFEYAVAHADAFTLRIEYQLTSSNEVKVKFAVNNTCTGGTHYKVAVRIYREL